MNEEKKPYMQRYLLNRGWNQDDVDFVGFLISCAVLAFFGGAFILLTLG